METLQRTANRGSVSTGPYEIDNSTKFEADNTERMYRAWGGSGGGNDQTWTVSLWVKRTELGTLQHIWGAGVSGNDVLLVSFQTDNTLKFRSTKDGANDCVYVTNRVFRDTNAWMHIVVAVDTTSGTAGDRLRIYINGVEETSFSTETDFAQNDNTLHNANSSYMEIATAIGEADRFCGYIAEVISISGSQLAPTTFGETDSDTGVWIPIQYTGSFPQNSVFLEFKDSSSLGTDTSGNGQTFTLQNITAADQSVDSPTNNFATFNVLQPRASGTTITKGGTDFYINSNYQTAVSSIAVTTGKWYAEFTCDSTTSFIGIVDVEDAYVPQNHTGYYLGYAGGNQNRSVGLRLSDGALLNRTGDFWGAAASAGNIIGIGLNMDDRKINFSVNGTWMSSDNSGTPANGATWNTSSTLGDAWTDVITMGVTGYSNIHWKCNFGGYTDISISSGNSDANGYGNFEYAVPSGFYALCSKNLAEYG